MNRVDCNFPVLSRRSRRSRQARGPSKAPEWVRYLPADIRPYHGGAMGPCVGPMPQPWCRPTPVMRAMASGGFIPPQWVATNRPVTQQVSEWGFLLRIFLFWLGGGVFPHGVSGEVEAFIARRWTLASRPGPLCREDFLRINDSLGWSSRILTIRRSLPLLTRLRRFLCRGTDWVLDIRDFSYISLEEGHQRILSAI